MTKNELISELLDIEGEASFLAYSLKGTYNDLKHHHHLVTTNQHYVPIWDHDSEIELEELTKLQEALKLVYNWYATDSIN